MNIKEARELAQNVLNNKLIESKKKHKLKVQEIFETSHSFIESAAKNGKFDTMLCIDYDRYNHNEIKFLESVAQEVKYKLINEGYAASIHNNYYIESINLTIKW